MQAFSFNKHQNTVKCFLRLTHKGVVSYISNGWVQCSSKRLNQTNGNNYIFYTSSYQQWPKAMMQQENQGIRGFSFIHWEWFTCIITILSTWKYSTFLHMDPFHHNFPPPAILEFLKVFQAFVVRHISSWLKDLDTESWTCICTQWHRWSMAINWCCLPTLPALLRTRLCHLQVGIS